MVVCPPARCLSAGRLIAWADSWLRWLILLLGSWVDLAVADGLWFLPSLAAAEDAPSVVRRVVPF